MSYSREEHIQEKLNRIEKLLTDLSYEAERKFSLRALEAQEDLQEVKRKIVIALSEEFQKGVKAGYSKRALEDDRMEYTENYL